MKKKVLSNTRDKKKRGMQRKRCYVEIHHKAVTNDENFWYSML